MRRSISKPLSNDAFQRAISTGHIINAKPDAVAIAKVELSKVAVQVLLLAVLIHALHAALKNRIVAFDSVGVDDVRLTVPNVFIAGVLHSIMAGEDAAQRVVPSAFVGHHRSFFLNVSANDREQLRDAV